MKPVLPIRRHWELYRPYIQSQRRDFILRYPSLREDFDKMSCKAWLEFMEFAVKMLDKDGKEELGFVSCLLSEYLWWVGGCRTLFVEDEILADFVCRSSYRDMDLSKLAIPAQCFSVVFPTSFKIDGFVLSPSFVSFYNPNSMVSDLLETELGRILFKGVSRDEATDKVKMYSNTAGLVENPIMHSAYSDDGSYVVEYLFPNDVKKIFNGDDSRSLDLYVYGEEDANKKDKDIQYQPFLSRKEKGLKAILGL